MRFVDEVEVDIHSGKGGRGSSSMRREMYVEMGGPDGGDGGRGGNVSFLATSGMHTLLDLRSRSAWRAGDGVAGSGRRRTGAQGADLVIPVPVGTIVRDAASDAVLFELLTLGEERIAAPGGIGGLGNPHFKSSTNRAPRTTTPGGPSIALTVRLELRLMADVGLLGYPNAGKSTLISVISAARPKVADYPFTTLVPNLGVVSMGEQGNFVVADIPGLIEGAAEGKGLGHQFLRHLQRTRTLLHLVSLSPMEADSVAHRYRSLRNELVAYDTELAEKPELVVLTQRDTVDDEAEAEARQALTEAGAGEIHVISAIAGDGIKPLLQRTWARISEIPRS
ncbi:MAG: GTPase ObgE [Pseudomonadota bacterium]|nr:GTPase ObgE [Pseudomonadota bacterium]